MPPATRDRAIEIIERNARSQAQLIEDLLDVSRIMSGKLALDSRLIDIVSVVAAAVETVRPAAQARSINLEVNVTTSGVVACHHSAGAGLVGVDHSRRPVATSMPTNTGEAALSMTRFRWMRACWPW